MFYLSDPFLLIPAGKKPDKKRVANFPGYIRNFVPIFPKRGVFVSPASLATPAVCNLRKPGTG